MPHSLQILSTAYSKVVPVFAKRSKQLFRSVEHLKTAADRSAASGQPDASLFTAAREYKTAYPAFATAFASRPTQLFHPEADQILTELRQLDQLMKHVDGVLTAGSTEKHIVDLVQEIMLITI